MARNRIPVEFNAPLESVDALASWLRNSRCSGTFYSRHDVDSRGYPSQWRVNGQLKRWKLDRTRMALPLKYGMGYSRNDHDSVTSIESFNRDYATGYTVTEQKS